MRYLTTTILALLIALLVTAPARATFQCAVGNSDAFLPMDAGSGSTVYTTSQGQNTGFVQSLYGPDQSAGSNTESSVSGGAAHLALAQTKSAAITPLCANGAAPVASVCGDASVPTIGVVNIGQSLGHRWWNSATGQISVAAINTFYGQRNVHSFLDQWYVASHRVDVNGAAALTGVTFNPKVTLADCGFENHNADNWGNNLDWTDSTTPSSWWSCANVRVPNYSVTGASTQAMTTSQVQVVFLLLQLGLSSGSAVTVLPMDSLAGADCAAANVTGGAGPEVFMCDIKHYLGLVIRNLIVGFPNVKLVYVTDMLYEGATSAITSAPPCDYEYGFATKSLIWAQTNQAANGGVVQDTVIGDLCAAAPCPGAESPVAPVIEMGPTIWAKAATTANAQGQIWRVGNCPSLASPAADYNNSDCVHESTDLQRTPPNGSSNMAGATLAWLYTNAQPAGTKTTTWALPPAPVISTSMFAIVH